MDRAWLESFAPWRRRRGLCRLHLAGAPFRRRPNGDHPVRLEAPDPYDWYSRRIRDGHDIWLVLTGYSRDLLGEMSIVAFTFGQTHGLGLAFISGGVALRSGNKAAQRATWEGYRRGCTPAWLPGEDCERLMAESVEAAKARLRLGHYPHYDAVQVDARNDSKFSHASPHLYHGLAPAQPAAA